VEWGVKGQWWKGKKECKRGGTGREKEHNEGGEDKGRNERRKEWDWRE
jgi:hypothetical protein